MSHQGWVGAGCEAKSCRSDPERVSHGTIECSHVDAPLRQCNISCNEGYVVSGKGMIECSTQGMWPTFGKCVPSCPPDNCHHHGTCVAPVSAESIISKVNTAK
jgi:hypothetical protein